MGGDLRGLAGRNQGADGDQAAVPRREFRPQPEISKQDIRRVLDKTGGDLSELLPDARRALRLRCLVERKLRPGSRRELICPDIAVLEHVLRRRNSIYGIGPASIE